MGGKWRDRNQVEEILRTGIVWIGYAERAKAKNRANIRLIVLC
jgi:hypothetical protein